MTPDGNNYEAIWLKNGIQLEIDQCDQILVLRSEKSETYFGFKQGKVLLFAIGASTVTGRRKG